VWEHIVEGHPEMLGQEPLVKAAIESPDRICEGYGGREMFELEARIAARSRRGYLLVVVGWATRVDGTLVGSVVTAYPDLNRARGDPTWRASTNSE